MCKLIGHALLVICTEIQEKNFYFNNLLQFRTVLFVPQAEPGQENSEFK